MPAPAAAQQTVSFQYDWMSIGSGSSLDGLAVDFDTPVYGDAVTLAAGGAFVTGSDGRATLSQAFLGAGPGIRHDTGTVELYAHALFGYRRDAGGGLLSGLGQSGFDARLAAGVNYPMNRRYALRAGIAYTGDMHATVGIAMRF